MLHKDITIDLPENKCPICGTVGTVYMEIYRNESHCDQRCNSMFGCRACNETVSIDGHAGRCSAFQSDVTNAILFVISKFQRFAGRHGAMHLDMYFQPDGRSVIDDVVVLEKIGAANTTAIRRCAKQHQQSETQETAR